MSVYIMCSSLPEVCARYGVESLLHVLQLTRSLRQIWRGEFASCAPAYQKFAPDMAWRVCFMCSSLPEVCARYGVESLIHVLQLTRSLRQIWRGEFASCAPAYQKFAPDIAWRVCAMCSSLPEVCARYGVESLRHVLGRSQPEYPDLARLEVPDHGLEALCRGKVCVADARTVDDDRDDWGTLHKIF
jgi:hypothetical protein